MPEVPKEPEPVSEAVRRTLMLAADIKGLEERIKERVRESKMLTPPVQVSAVPKSSRTWTGASSTPVGIACCAQVAEAFQRGGFNAGALNHATVIVDRRLTPTGTQFFYDDVSWQERLKEQAAWEAAHPAPESGEPAS